MKPHAKSRRKVPNYVVEIVKKHYGLSDSDYSLSGIITYNDELRRLRGVETIMPTEEEVVEFEESRRIFE